MQEVKAIDLKIGDKFLIKGYEQYSCQVLNVYKDSLSIYDTYNNSPNIHKLDLLNSLTLFINNPVITGNTTIPVTTNNCRHVNKFKNHAGGQYFWQCKDCKNDLGNV